MLHRRKKAQNQGVRLVKIKKYVYYLQRPILSAQKTQKSQLKIVQTNKKLTTEE